jgi:RNA polymerase sigma-70 factor (ECF subfamily)
MAARSISLTLLRGGASASEEVPPSRQPSEKALVAGLRAGEPEACDRVYRLYARDVWRMLYRILGDDSDLDDLHHEVFVQVLRSAARFRHEAALKTWIIGIAVNCARSRLRSKRRRSWLRFMAPEELPDPPGEDHGDAATTVDAVYQLANRMPTDERIVLLLRFVEGMSSSEIAAALQVSAGTAKRRLARATQRFMTLAAGHPALRDLCRGELSVGGKP